MRASRLSVEDFMDRDLAEPTVDIGNMHFFALRGFGLKDFRNSEPRKREP